MSTISRPRAVYGVSKKNVPGVLVRSHAVYAGLADHPDLYPSPTMAPAAFLLLVQNLEAAQIAAINMKAKGAGTVRNTKRDLLWSGLELERAYVQGLADTATVEHARTLIVTAGFLVAQVAIHQKAILQAQIVSTDGTVQLLANARVLVGPANIHRKVTFHWQFGEEGKPLADAPSTPYAHTRISGLKLMTTYAFRVRVTVGTTSGQWTDPVTLLIH